MKKSLFLIIMLATINVKAQNKVIASDETIIDMGRTLVPFLNIDNSSDSEKVQANKLVQLLSGYTPAGFKVINNPPLNSEAAILRKYVNDKDTIFIVTICDNESKPYPPYNGWWIESINISAKFSTLINLYSKYLNVQIPSSLKDEQYPHCLNGHIDFKNALRIISGIYEVYKNSTEPNRSEFNKTHPDYWSFFVRRARDAE